MAIFNSKLFVYQRVPRNVQYHMITWYYGEDLWLEDLGFDVVCIATRIPGTTENIMSMIVAQLTGSKS